MASSERFTDMADAGWYEDLWPWLMLLQRPPLSREQRASEPARYSWIPFSFSHVKCRSVFLGSFSDFREDVPITLSSGALGEFLTGSD